MHYRGLRVLCLVLVLVLSIGACTAALGEGETKGEPIQIEWFVPPIIGTPLPDKSADPYYQYLLEKFNADVTLTVSADFMTELITRFVSGNAPDMINFDTEAKLMQLYNQGVLIEDWSVYQDQMPALIEGMGETAKTFYTREGKLVCLPIQANGQKWSWEIRKDWLQKLGLEMPTTSDELLDVARAFTQQDPDGNGKNDTFAFTSTGANKNIGEISNLLGMFTPPSWYIDEAKNEVGHPYLNGGHKQFLDFMRIIVKDGLIDPDWYTQQWDERKPNLFAGAFGVVWYPPMALLNEISIAVPDANVVDWWSMMGMPKGSEIGGKLPVPFSPIGMARSSPAALANDPTKLAVVTAIYEDLAWPNEGCHKMMYGRDIDDYQFIELGDGYLYYDRNNANGKSLKGVRADQFEALWDWAYMGLYEDPFVIQGTSPEPNDVTYAFLELEKQTQAFQFYSDDNYLLVQDAQLQLDCEAVKDEFEIKYILGQTDDYDGFVTQWLATGGQALLDSATEQFKAMGKIK